MFDRYNFITTTYNFFFRNEKTKNEEKHDHIRAISTYSSKP